MLATLAAIRVAARDGEAEHLWHRTNNRWFKFCITNNEQSTKCFEFTSQQPGRAVSLMARNKLHNGGI